MSRLLDGYCRLLEWTIAIVLALMVLLVFDNVLLRYVANSGITVSEELSRWLLVWMMFLGAIVAVKKYGQLRDDGLVMVQESDDLAQVDALQLDRSATYKHESGASAMTVFTFLGSLLAVMALGVLIAYALLLSGVALMWHLDLFDAQILAQNVITGRAGGLIASAGIIAPVIPPSIGFVIFGGAANVSISKLFLAGIVPGLLMGASIALAWWWVAKTENVTPPKKASTAERLKALKESTWTMVLPVVVIVGLKFGVFTPTEAAVVAAVYALLVSTLVYRELPLHKLKDVFVSAAKTTSVIMFLVAAAMVSAWLITVADIPAKMIELLKPFMGNQTLLMTAIMVLVMAVGTAMDMTPTGLIMTPALVMVPARWVAN